MENDGQTTNMDFSDVRVEGFSLQGLLLAFALIASFLFIAYWLWGCNCGLQDESQCRENNSSYRTTTQLVPKQSVVPLYAFEIEPGTVVLQSENGEVFRILREYDSIGRTGTGSPPLYSSVTTSPTGEEYHYVPSYTRAHFQNRPTCPEWDSNPGLPQQQQHQQPQITTTTTSTPQSDYYNQCNSNANCNNVRQDTNAMPLQLQQSADTSSSSIELKHEDGCRGDCGGECGDETTLWSPIHTSRPR